MRARRYTATEIAIAAIGAVLLLIALLLDAWITSGGASSRGERAQVPAQGILPSGAPRTAFTLRRAIETAKVVNGRTNF